MQQDFPNGPVQHFLVLDEEFSFHFKDRGRILVIGIRTTQIVRRPKSVVGPFAGYAPLQKMGLSQKWHRRQTPPWRRKEGREDGTKGEADDKTGKYRCVHRIVGLMSRAHPPLPVAAASGARAELVCHF